LPGSRSTGVSASSPSGLGDDVEVLAGLQRHVDPDLGRELAGPDAGGQHHGLGLDAALLGVDPGDGVLVGAQPGDAMSSRMRTPRLRAPLASAMVVSTGDVWPSRGMYSAPTMSSVRISGQRSRSSSMSISRVSTPTDMAMAAPRRISSQRSASAATETDPGVRQPVACPVSSSSAS